MSRRRGGDLPGGPAARLDGWPEAAPEVRARTCPGGLVFILLGIQDSTTDVLDPGSPAADPDAILRASDAHTLLGDTWLREHPGGCLYALAYDGDTGAPRAVSRTYFEPSQPSQR